MLAQRSKELLAQYRRGEPVGGVCPLKEALGEGPAGQADVSEVSS
jgi:hypothetical protein